MHLGFVNISLRMSSVVIVSDLYNIKLSGTATIMDAKGPRLVRLGTANHVKINKLLITCKTFIKPGIYNIPMTSVHIVDIQYCRRSLGKQLFSAHNKSTQHGALTNAIVRRYYDTGCIIIVYFEHNFEIYHEIKL